MSPQVPALNLFPARVEGTGLDRELKGVRVFVANGIARVFESPTSPSVETAEVVSVLGNPSKKAPATITFADGTTWQVYRAGGCGCGDPLKKNFHARNWM